MIKRGTSNEPLASLPYGMLITKVLKVNGVDLKDCVGKDVEATYDKHTLKSMKYKRVDGEWVRISDLVEVVQEEEEQNPSQEPSPSQPSGVMMNTLIQSLTNLNETVQNMSNKLDILKDMT